MLVVDSTARPALSKTLDWCSEPPMLSQGFAVFRGIQSASKRHRIRLHPGHPRSEREWSLVEKRREAEIERSTRRLNFARWLRPERCSFACFRSLSFVL